MFEQRGTTNAGAAMWPGGDWERGEEGAVVRAAPTAAQNIILCHQFDLIVAQPTSELCPTVAPHSAAIDTLAWSWHWRRLAAVATTTTTVRTDIQLPCFTSMLHLSNYAQTDSPMHTHTHTLVLCVGLYSYLLVYVISSKRNNRTS